MCDIESAPRGVPILSPTYGEMPPLTPSVTTYIELMVLSTATLAMSLYLMRY
jgi:hypothetical protein